MPFKRILFISILYFKVWAAAGDSAAALPTLKKNVCSITVNSDNEINQFRNFFPSDQWNFIELTKIAKANDPDWFQRACEQKIECDILVVSGHFGGAFFGESEFRLPLEELESFSCRKGCGGIINKPKEVFLFGCNTLAGKDKDVRSPEQYLQALINDGFSLNQAQMVVAFRYSPMGSSFSSRMSQAFAYTPKIYGFNSIAPSGASIQKMLQTYLASSKNYYANFDRHPWNSPELASKKNSSLFSALKNTSIVQSTGANVMGGSSFEKPYCFLEDEARSSLDKLRYIKTLLESGKTLSFIPFIKDYIHRLSKEGRSLSPEEITVLNSLKNNQAILADFQKLLELKGNIYLKIRADILALMRDLRIISEETFNTDILATLGVDFNVPPSIEIKDLICSAEVQADVPVDQIPSDRWNGVTTLQLFACLKPQNLSMSKKLLELMLDMNKQEPLRSAAADTLKAIKPTFSEILAELGKQLLENKDWLTRANAALILGASKTLPLEIQLNLAEVLMKDQIPYVQFTAGQALERIKPQDSKVLLKIAEVAKNSPSDYIKDQAKACLESSKPLPSEVLEYLSKDQ